MGHCRQASLGIKSGTSEGWQMRQVLSADIQIHDVNQCETPPYPTPPLPHPACSLSCLKLTLSASHLYYSILYSMAPNMVLLY